MPNIFLNTLPFTEEGKGLELSEEIERDCKLVYRLDKDGGALFYGAYSPERDYDDEYVIVPFRSVYGGITEQLPIGTHFANIIGSSHDPNPYGSWIQLLAFIFGAQYAANCCTDGNIYSNNIILANNVCGNRMVGGHIIFGDNTDYAAQGNAVYMLPICSNHNVRTPRQPGNCYMILNASIPAVVLNGYLTASVIQKSMKQIRGRN